MSLRLFALSLFVVSACAGKADTSSATPEPEPTAQPEPTASTDDASADAPAEPAAKPTPPPAEPAATKDLVAVVSAQANTKTFVELLTASELDKELHSTDISLTLLVPTDEAFAKLPKGTLDKWKKNKDQLQKTLKFHFIPGVNNSQKIGNYRTAPTAAGPELEVKTSQDSDMTIEGARLIEVNIEASNGMVHLIDKVLQPKKGK